MQKFLAFYFTWAGCHFPNSFLGICSLVMSPWRYRFMKVPGLDWETYIFSFRVVVVYMEVHVLCVCMLVFGCIEAVIAMTIWGPTCYSTWIMIHTIYLILTALVYLINCVMNIHFGFVVWDGSYKRTVSILVNWVWGYLEWNLHSFSVLGFQIWTLC